MHITSHAGLALMLLVGAADAEELDKNCAMGMAMGHQMQTDCSVRWEADGRTYCFSSEQSMSMFLKDKEVNLAKAEAFYAKVAEPVREKISQQEALNIIKRADCDLSNKDAGYLEFDGMDLHHCKMVNTSFFGAYLRGANLSGANMQRAYLNLARLEGTNLSGADLRDATIFQAIFNKTNFKGANLANARVIGTLPGVDMSGANIAKGRFGLDVGNQPMGQMKFDSVSGNFAGANFQGADLNIASFRFANLANANLRDTNLYRADLGQADLTGADLTGANLDSAELDGATFKDVKGLDTVKGMNTVKGKCQGC